jgi:hypothetical protein
LIAQFTGPFFELKSLPFQLQALPFQLPSLPTNFQFRAAAIVDVFASVVALALACHVTTSRSAGQSSDHTAESGPTFASDGIANASPGPCPDSSSAQRSSRLRAPKQNNLENEQHTGDKITTSQSLPHNVFEYSPILRAKARKIIHKIIHKNI